MKDTILEKATEMYLKLGFKGVTLDDIAQEMSISKKTIYQHFSNRNELIEVVVLKILNTISEDIDRLISKGYDAMEELFEIRRYLRKTLEDKYQLVLYQLNRFFPEIAVKLRAKQFDKMHNSVIDNLQRGISEGLYRAEINPDFISRIYFLGASGTKDTDIFPENLFTVQQSTNLFLEYHMRAIATPKGLEQLEKYMADLD